MKRENMSIATRLNMKIIIQDLEGGATEHYAEITPMYGHIYKRSSDVNSGYYIIRVRNTFTHAVTVGSKVRIYGHYWLRIKSVLIPTRRSKIIEIIAVNDASGMHR